MSGPILGWDVGGANLKAARFERDRKGGSDPRALERPFALWRELERLPDVLQEVAGELGAAGTMAITMTAELADCFATKREGVGRVLEAFRVAFPGVELQVFTVDGKFISPTRAARRPLRVASANWMATAILLSDTVRNAFLIDVGSTTTDVIPIVGGQVAARGRTDPARLRSGELVYTGALRTPVCAIVRTLPFRGKRCRVAAEHFAIAADAHLWLGWIAEGDYTCETPDGRGRTREEAGARLARMICADREMLSPEEVTAIAERVEEAQVDQITSGLRQVRRRLGPASPRTAVLVGQGAFLGQAAADAVGLTVTPLDARLGSAVVRSAPAVAVAALLARSRVR